jgi:hypothetical protein
MDNLFEQMANITKAHAYDTVAVPQIQELKEENRRMAKIIQDFLGLYGSDDDAQAIALFEAARKTLKDRKPYNL